MSRAGGGNDDCVAICIVVSTMQPFVAGARSKKKSGFVVVCVCVMPPYHYEAISTLESVQVEFLLHGMEGARGGWYRQIRQIRQ